MVVDDLDIVGVTILPNEQTRRWSLTRMLCCPVRSPTKVSRRLSGGFRRSSSLVADANIRCLRRATVARSLLYMPGEEDATAALEVIGNYAAAFELMAERHLNELGGISSSVRVSACERIDGQLDRRCASFETAAARLRQDEEILYLATLTYFILRSAPPRRRVRRLLRTGGASRNTQSRIEALRQNFVPALIFRPEQGVTDWRDVP